MVHPCGLDLRGDLKPPRSSAAHGWPRLCWTSPSSDSQGNSLPQELQN